MPVFQLSDELIFPPAELAEASGLLAVGGDLRPERLLLAYAQGIFPWPQEGELLAWFSPDPRMVLRARDLHVSRRLRRTLQQRRFEVRLDTAFRDVIEHCARIERKGQRGTWITRDMIDAYCRLHELGYVHSAEAWREGALVGGIYGVWLGGVFTGESMFALVPDASKVALVTLVRQLERWGCDLLDAQVYSEHLARLGATEWPRRRFLEELRRQAPPPLSLAPGRRWRLDADLWPGATA
jgi:leucyl/phenylalanyl-tRNA--protein transferase